MNADILPDQIYKRSSYHQLWQKWPKSAQEKKTAFFSTSVFLQLKARMTTRRREARIPRLSMSLGHRNGHQLNRAASGRFFWSRKTDTSASRGETLVRSGRAHDGHWITRGNSDHEKITQLTWQMWMDGRNESPTEFPPSSQKVDFPPQSLDRNQNQARSFRIPVASKHNLRAGFEPRTSTLSFTCSWNIRQQTTVVRVRAIEHSTL